MLKRSPRYVTVEEIRSASQLWQLGFSKSVIADQIGWTGCLLERVIESCRDFGTGPQFPHRHPQQSQQSRQDHAVLEAAKKPLQSPPPTQKNDTWRHALSSKGLKGSTVKTRRPGDYLPTRKRAVDTTLSLPAPSQVQS